jgi:hypothetical protein
MEEGGVTGEIDLYLGTALRAQLEERLWRPIGAGATLEAMLSDPAFLADPGTHPAMFADHGVVHARDVATGVVRLLRVADGVLLAPRPAERRRFMEALGVATAYLHDIGMIDLTHAGRRVHAIVGAHAAFGAEADELVAHLLAGGPVRERLDEVAAAAPFHAPVEVVLRELLALSVLHSKSVVPAAAFDDRTAMRRLLQRLVFTPLAVHRAQPRPPGPDDGAPPVAGAGAHPLPPELAFAWLVPEDGSQRALADDALDAMRALRAADVLRQRGTVLRTSGGFEVCMDATTARAVSTLRPAGGGAAYVVAYDDPRGAGEANIAEAQVTRRGDLRVAVHRGAFTAPGANELAVASVANVLLDIAADVLPSFDGPSARAGLPAPAVRPGSMRVLLERPPDRTAFAAEVVAAMAALEPGLASRVDTVSDTHTADPSERDRYLAAEPVDALDGEGAGLLARIAARGADVAHLDVASAFGEVVRARVDAGERLLGRGSPPSFVYVPLDEGLVVIPDGGYAPAPLPPWIPVGTTGVIRRAERNSDILAERGVEVLVIPAECYARTWLRPMSVEDLARRALHRVSP